MRSLALLALCMLTPVLRAGAAKPLFEQVDLFKQHDGITDTYRIPALAVTNKGVIVAVADARRDSWRDLPGNIDLAMRRSKDLGKTWEPMRVIQDFPKGHGAGDPSLILDRRTNRLFCFYTYSPPGVGSRNSRPGTADTTDPHTVHAHVIHSDDDGVTWTTATPVDLNPQIKNPAWVSAMTTSGRGLQTRDGRMIQIYFVKPASGPGAAAAAYSDDGGKTWQPGGTAGTGTGESKVFERTNGDIVINMRAGAGPGYRHVAVSRDGAKTFGPAAPDYALPDPGCNADVLRVSPKVVLYSGLGVLNTRVRLTIRASYDDGRTWPVSRVVHAGPAGYSTMALLPDGTVGLFYERGNNDLHRDMGTRETMTFARFNLEWLAEKIPVVSPAGELNATHPALWAWFDAGKLAARDGEAVTSWNDLAPGGIRNLPSASPAPPKLRSIAANGKPAVDFERDRWLTASPVAWNGFRHLPNGFTMFIVGRVKAGAGPLIAPAENAPGLTLAANDGKWTLRADRAGAADPPLSESHATFPASDRFQLHTVTLYGNRLSHSVNRARPSAATLDDKGVPLYQGSLRLTGESEIAEIAVYTAVLDSDSIGRVQRALMQKYGL